MRPACEPQPAFQFDPARYPDTPGCYLIKDSDRQVLFVGMTKNLRRRLASLFDGSLALSTKPLPGRSRYLDVRPQMLARIHEIEVILVENETDCTNLVNALITRLKPHFNLATFLDPYGTSYIIQTHEALPRFLPAGHKRAAKEALPRGASLAASYGPYPSAVRDALLKCIQQVFGLRTCEILPDTACLSYSLKKCSAPCENHISADEYADRAAQAAHFLSSPTAGLMDYMQERMHAAAQSLEFERARLLRDLLLQLQEAVATQPNQGLSDHDQDVVWLDQGRVLTLHLRQGRLEALSEYAAPGGADAALAFLKEHYRHNCPPELITAPLPGAAALAAGLSGSNGYAVTVTTAASGRPAELLKMAQINHAYRLTSRLPEKTKGQATL